MKKLVILVLLVMFALQIIGCGDDNSPKYSTHYLHNDTHHWRVLESGDGEPYTDYAPHVKDGGRCSVCEYYYDVSEFLEFAKYYERVGSQSVLKGYQIIRFKGEGSNAPVHIKIPSSYKGVGDEEALPVVKIYNYAFKVTGDSNKYWNYDEDTETYGYPTDGNPLNVAIESVIIPDTIKIIGSGAFASTRLKEVVIPDSVTSTLPNVFGGCVQLEKAVIGNGVTDMGGYTFSSCTNLSDVRLGKNIKSISGRAFYECKNLKKIALPKSLVHLPETSIRVGNVNDKLVSVPDYFLYAKEIFLEITEEELEALEVPLYERDVVTGEIIEDGISRKPGYREDWSGMAKIYFVGEWHYDANGEPVPN